MSSETFAQDDLTIEAAYLEALLNSMHNECITGKISGVLGCRSNPSADKVDALQKELYPDLHQSVSGFNKAYTTMATGMGWLKSARKKTQAVTPDGTKVKSSVKSYHLLKKRKKVRFIKTVAVYGVDHGLTDGVSIEFLNSERVGEPYYKQHLNLLEEHQRARTSIADYDFDSTNGERPSSADSTVATSMSNNISNTRPSGLGIIFPDPDIASDATSRPVDENRDLHHMEHHASTAMSRQPRFFEDLNVTSSRIGSIVSTSDYESSNMDKSTDGMVDYLVYNARYTPPSSFTETSLDYVVSHPDALPLRHDQQNLPPDITPTVSLHTPSDQYISLLPASPYAGEPAEEAPRQDHGKDSVMTISDFLKQSRLPLRSFRPSSGSNFSRSRGTFIDQSSVHPALRHGVRTYGSTPALREDWLTSLRRRAVANHN